MSAVSSPSSRTSSTTVTPAQEGEVDEVVECVEEIVSTLASATPSPGAAEESDDEEEDVIPIISESDDEDRVEAGVYLVCKGIPFHKTTKKGKTVPCFKALKEFLGPRWCSLRVKDIFLYLCLGVSFE
jgi:hypothetical protein